MTILRLFQVSADEIDKVLGEFGGDLLLGAVDEVKTDVVFEHLGHEAVDAAANRGQQHQLVAAVGVALQRALDGVQLPAHLADSLEELHLFTFVVGHRHLLLDNTHPGYGI